MLENYFKDLYHRTMDQAYSYAYQEILSLMKDGGKCLDCGANKGEKFDLLNKTLNINLNQYTGIEWRKDVVEEARDNGINMIHGDLNQAIALPDNEFDCVFGLSVIEHLLNPCQFIKECQRVLKKDGVLILLTPNISTYFTAMLILLGKMPSSGPHPDSDELIKKEEIFKVSSNTSQPDIESDTPTHRHIVVFSYRVLKSYLKSAGFKEIVGHGYGLYPFPNFLQPLLEKIDPYHCHQMVFIAKK